MKIFVCIALACLGPLIGYIMGDIASDNNTPVGVWVAIAWIGPCITAAFYFDNKQ